MLIVYIVSGCHSSSPRVQQFYEHLDTLLRCWEEYIVENIPVSVSYSMIVSVSYSMIVSVSYSMIVSVSYSMIVSISYSMIVSVSYSMIVSVS